MLRCQLNFWFLTIQPKIQHCNHRWSTFSQLSQPFPYCCNINVDNNGHSIVTWHFWRSIEVCTRVQIIYSARLRFEVPCLLLFIFLRHCSSSPCNNFDCTLHHWVSCDAHDLAPSVLHSTSARVDWVTPESTTIDIFSHVDCFVKLPCSWAIVVRPFDVQHFCSMCIENIFSNAIILLTYFYLSINLVFIYIPPNYCAFFMI